MNRTAAITRAEQQFDSGEFKAVLARRIAIPTESQNPDRADVLAQYLHQELQPAFEAMGFETSVFDFYSGFGWQLGAYLLGRAILLWLLADISSALSAVKLRVMIRQTTIV